MIEAVRDGQFDVGMDGITITDERKKQVDFSDPYMVSQQFMLVRADESRFTDAKTFAADKDLLIGAQAGTTNFYVAVYNVLDGDEKNPRVKLFDTFGASVQALKSGDVDLVLMDKTSAAGYMGASPNSFKIVGDPLGTEEFGFILKPGSDLVAADQCGNPGDEGRRHLRQAQQEVVLRLPSRQVSEGSRRGPCRLRRRRSARELPYWLLATALLAPPLPLADRHERKLPHHLRGASPGRAGHALGDGRCLCARRRPRPRRRARPALRAIRVLREVATFYVEIIRGIPVLVLLFYVAFVGAPIWSVPGTTSSPGRSKPDCCRP